ncbi:reverse transcriptase zinc-binding domain-containing protein [Tanacetum coccineum]
MKQVVEDVGDDEDFNSGSWVGATEYVKPNGGIISGCLGDIKTFIKNGKLEQVEITIGSAIILANVSVFSPNPSMHYLNITKKNVVKVFHKDFVPGNGSGVGGSGMLMEEEEIFDEEALDLVLEEEARESRAHEEWLEKCRQQEEEDAEHERQLLGFHGTI